MKIVIDPGHGGVWRPEPPKGDPGVVSLDGKKIESHYNWLYANTVRDVFVLAGFKVELTRDNDEHTVPYTSRTNRATGDDLFISIHFDTYAGGKSLIYYSDTHGESYNLAQSLDIYLQTDDLRSTVQSRFGRLYIDDNLCPAVLVEVDRIDKADDSIEERLELANKLLSGVRDYLGIKDAGGVVDEEGFNTPFQRVFLIEDGEQKQLDIERMSIVGDKLYIAVK